jgi:predicted Zn finger-like uncharacterized protein
MYTQCPECHTAFRVTARVLQQAGGRVRCGGCASAFNALDYLSEELPQVHDDAGRVDQPSDNDTQNRKLLETLDQLAGSENVVIEDTGVEWQVMEDSSDNDATGEIDISDTGTMRWTIEDVDDDVEAVPEIVDKVPLASSPDDESVMRFDDNTPLPDDFDDIVTTSTPTPHRRQEDRIELEKRHLDDIQIDLALGEPDDWVDLLDEVDEVDEASQDADRDVSLEVEEELSAIHSELTARPAGIDSKAPQLDSDEELSLDDDDDYVPDVIDSRIEQLPGDDDDSSLAHGLDSTGEFEEQIEEARKALSGESEGEPDDAEDTYEQGLSLEDEQADEEEEMFGEDDDSIAELVLRGELRAADDSADPDSSTETDDGSSPQAEEPASQPRYPAHLFDENSDNVETIIMEGEFVHASLHEQMQDAKNKAENIDEAAFLADTYSISRNKIRGGRRKGDPAGTGTVAMVVVLVLVLAVQVIHSSRETLMTIGAFNQTIAPVYRLLGKPIIPEWDIKGWQFQTTNGSTDESGNVLTILSTVANRSSQALPYPLVHVSLTDRWEEIIGSRVLEPNEYLAGDLDPSRPVSPGDKFTAVISIHSPSEEATGFKLNVCYRFGPGRVRCATEDFKE